MLTILVPQCCWAQGIVDQVHGLHGVLDKLYKEMLPMCADLIGVGRAIAGFAATFYIGYRVWKHIANAEPVDFFPLFRPFCLGFCILIFPQVIALCNSILKPTVVGTEALRQKANSSVAALLAKREEEMKKTVSYRMYGINDGQGDRDLWMLYTHDDEVGDEGLLGSIGNDIEFAMSKAYYNFKSGFKEFISFVLQLLYEAAALCINTVRTFNLLVLALLGPFVFGLACFDGFAHTLTVYLARYVNFYLWLPIANILGALLGKIQEGMLKLDIDQITQYGDTFFTSSDVGYLIFMIIGIISYTTIPNLSNMVVNSGGGSALTAKITSMAAIAPTTAAAMATGGVSTAALMVDRAGGMAGDAFGNMNLMMSQGMGAHGTGSGYFGSKLSDDPNS
ncbi:conjugative transposon protein TraJ [Chitinophaga filiformis]|uniref:Conjugative transposon protein TraJ n=1 Tax=Chitinophaga filiformis TaxID=104663 RepID=A0ABY4I017_CHIFI|nr:conjugative transposon protein TraJ [Chitinophaga filiformis]UPK68026.1 conjugative transposon protein TraJ [Chitinophaga filiformis]